MFKLSNILRRLVACLDLEAFALLIPPASTFAVFNASLKDSSLKLAYSLEDPFDANTQVPTFWVQRLAYDFYREGDYKKAEFLIQKNINHIERLLRQKDVEDFLRVDDTGCTSPLRVMTLIPFSLHLSLIRDSSPYQSHDVES